MLVTYFVNLGSWMTTYLGKSCSFCLPRVPFVNCRQFMYLVISLLVLRAGYGIWLYQFLIIAYLFTLLRCRIWWVMVSDLPIWLYIPSSDIQVHTRSHRSARSLDFRGCIQTFKIQVFFFFFFFFLCILWTMYWLHESNFVGLLRKRRHRQWHCISPTVILIPLFPLTWWVRIGLPYGFEKYAGRGYRIGVCRVEGPKTNH